MKEDNPWRAISARGPATLWTKLNPKGRVMYHVTMNNIFFTQNHSICLSVPIPPRPNQFSIYSTPRSAWARWDRNQEREDGKERLRNAQESNR